MTFNDSNPCAFFQTCFQCVYIFVQHKLHLIVRLKTVMGKKNQYPIQTEVLKIKILSSCYLAVVYLNVVLNFCCRFAVSLL